MARGVFVDATTPVYTDFNDCFNAPHCTIYNSANISIAVSGTAQALTFDSEVVDSGNMHSVSVNTSRINIPAGGTGIYLLNGACRFAANATGYRQLEFRVNGVTTIHLHRELNAGAGGPSYVSIGCIYPLTAGDYVELLAAQSSGGALNAEAVGTYGIQFSAQWKAVS